MGRRFASSGRRVHLHRAVSKLGWGSRRQAWDWIRAGQIAVDGAIVLDPLTWIDLDRQIVTRRGEQSPLRQHTTVALHKPTGYVTTRADERGRPTVHDLLADDLPYLFAVGRLDADSEGLLLFTTDSALAVRLTDPEHHVPRTYHVTVTGQVSEAEVERLRGGVDLRDGRTRPAKVRVLDQGADRCVLEVILTEGRNRQIRRMLATVGHEVRRLMRTAIGGLQLGELAEGKWRILSEEEIELAGRK